MKRDSLEEGMRLKELLSNHNKQLPKKERLTQEAIAHDLDVTQGAVSNMLNGKLQMTVRHAVYFANALGVSIAAFSPGLCREHRNLYELRPENVESNLMHAKTMEGYVPEISWVQAGQWMDSGFYGLIDEDAVLYPRPPGASEECFALRVVGESMAPDYQPGWVIFVDPARKAKSGDDIVAVMTETGEATFKRFVEEPGIGKMLRALNPAFSHQYIPINGNCHVAGVVIAAMRINT